MPALVGTAAGALYVRFAAPAVGGGNSGEFQVMAYLLGIAHPPSYPLYLLLAHVAAALPLPGDVAWRINALTGVLAAVAVALTAALPPLLLPFWRGSRLAGAVAAASLLAAPRLWTLSVEAEVFSLHLLLVVGFWAALAKWAAGPAHPGAGRWLVLATLLAGLGMANHRTTLFFAGAGVLFVLLTRARTLLNVRLLAWCAGAFAAGLLPYVYVLRGLVFPVPYFSPADVHRLSRGEAWYVLQGNASGETGGGRIVLDLLQDRAQLAQRTVWAWRHLVGQFGVAGPALAVLAVAGLCLLGKRCPRWTACAVLGSLGATLFAMAYGKYPDGDRYLLPLETLLCLGLGTLLAAGALLLDSALRSRAAAAVAGALGGLACGAYLAFQIGVLAGTTSLTRGGYVYFTVHNLDGLNPNAVACTWWASAWGWWYAQYVDGHRPDVAVVAKGPDECIRDVVPQEFGHRPVYLPALTDKVKAAPYSLFPSRDLWLVVGPRPSLTEGALLKGPDDRIYLFEQGQRRWITSMDVFTRRGLNGFNIQPAPDYLLAQVPEGAPLTD